MRYLIVIYTLFLMWSCGGDSASDKCKYGEPVPIFSGELDQVESHNFQRKGQKGVEELVFADRTRLEIFQSGCNEIRQEFRFFIPSPETPLADSLWFDKANERMVFLGSLDDKYMSLGMTGELIRQQKLTMQLGKFTGIDFDTYLLVDRIVEPDNTMLIVVLEKRS